MVRRSFWLYPVNKPSTTASPIDGRSMASAASTSAISSYLDQHAAAVRARLIC
jgi:hypothetical protein